MLDVPLRHRLHTCASGNGVDTCQGDSGGPLVCWDRTSDADMAGQHKCKRAYLHGITSFGFGCASSRFPGKTQLILYSMKPCIQLLTYHHYFIKKVFTCLCPGTTAGSDKKYLVQISATLIRLWYVKLPDVLELNVLHFIVTLQNLNKLYLTLANY